MKHFKIDYKIYPFSCLVFVSNKPKKIEKYLRKKILPDHIDVRGAFSGDYEAVCQMFESGQTVIVFRKGIKKLPGIVAHEAFHAVEFLAKRVGLKHSDESSEAFAYLLEHIVTNIHKNL